MTSNGDSPATKTCEFCGETILAVAKKCRHCKSMLGETLPLTKKANVSPTYDDLEGICNSSTATQHEFITGSGEINTLGRVANPQDASKGISSKKVGIIASIAICLIGLIAYVDQKHTKMAEQQAEIQRQQLRLAEEASKRQEMIDSKAKLDAKLAETKKFYSDLQRLELDRINLQAMQDGHARQREVIREMSR